MCYVCPGNENRQKMYSVCILCITDVKTTIHINLYLVCFERIKAEVTVNISFQVNLVYTSYIIVKQLKQLKQLLLCYSVMIVSLVVFMVLKA